MLLSPLLLPALLQPQALAPALPRRASPLVACMPPSEMKLAAPHASRGCSSGCSSEQPSPWSFDGSSEAGSIERPLVVLTCMTGAAAHSACHTLVAELVETIIDGRDAGKSWLRPIASRQLRGANSVVAPLPGPDLVGWTTSTTDAADAAVTDAAVTDAAVTVFSPSRPPLFIPSEMLRGASQKESTIVRALSAAHQQYEMDETELAQLETFMHL